MLKTHIRWISFAKNNIIYGEFYQKVHLYHIVFPINYLQRDFIPIDIPKNYVQRASVPGSNYVQTDTKFEDLTTSKEFLQNWGTQKRVRYGDFHENRNIQPVEKFLGSSVTKESFVPKGVVETKDFRPVHKAINKEGDLMFDTVYRDTFQKPSVKPCRAQIYLAQKEILRQQRAKAIASH